MLFRYLRGGNKSILVGFFVGAAELKLNSRIWTVRSPGPRAESDRAGPANRGSSPFHFSAQNHPHLIQMFMLNILKNAGLSSAMQ